MKRIRTDVEIVTTVMVGKFRYLRIHKYCVETNENTVEWFGNDGTNGVLDDPNNNVTGYTNLDDQNKIKELEEQYQKLRA